MITLELGPADAKHAFCESTHALAQSAWHLRELTDIGRKPGGGADTSALCGRTVSWDLEVPITRHHLAHACKACAKLYQASDEVPER